MNALLDGANSFRQRLRAGQALCGTFIKTPHHQVVEIAASAGMDFVVLDAEHAPFGPHELDTCLLGARASGVAAIVRVPQRVGPSTLQALDLGAAGILAPHVTDAATARAVVASAHYQGGTRGFSNSPRAGGFGAMAMATHLDNWDNAVSVLCQIEDREGVDNIEAIAAVPGIDCLFIGRADLAVSYGVADLEHPLVQAAVARVLAAGRTAGIATGIFLGDAGPVAAYASQGASLFLLGSDQSALKAGLARQASACAAACGTRPDAI